MVNGDRIRALRYAREVADDLHWRGMAVPSVYASMAEEFRALVRSGDYAAWVAGYDQAAAAPPQDGAASAAIASSPRASVVGPRPLRSSTAALRPSSLTRA
jgi:hypothetical protein